ncbi:MAG: hypothetical protein JST66_12400 [Bacteroidetes bacterium]|nr:hypothetical protein [Bacteroidota bacterium]
MGAPRRKRWIALAVLLAAIGLVAVKGPDRLARALRERSVAVVEQACGPYSRINIGRVSVELLPGNIRWADVDIVQQVDSTDTAWTTDRSLLISGHVDSIQVRGLSVWRLLFARTLAVEAIHVSGPRLEIVHSDRPASANTTDTGPKDLVTAIHLDTLVVDSGAVVLRPVVPERPRIACARFGLRVTDLRADARPPDGRRAPFGLTFATIAMALEGTDVALPPLYDAHVDTITLAHPDSLLRLRGIRLAPRKGPHDYGQAVRHETDLFRLTMDSLVLQGFDLRAALNDTTLRAGELRLAGTDLDVFRDKTLTDAPFQHKRMPARLLRELPFRVCIDSLVVQDMDIAYHEKDVVTPAYGVVVFSAVNAVARGLCTTAPAERPVAHLAVDARVYERAPIHLDFRTAVFDSSDHFSVHARIGALPFQVFNRMTDGLMLVRATSGTIGGIDYTLEADEDRAHGRVDLEYDRLTLSIRRRDGTGEKNKLLSFLANQITRSRNVRGDGFRHGDVAIERLKDRQIFNYVWRGLREGMMDTVLPKVVSSVKDATRTKHGKGRRPAGR